MAQTVREASPSYAEATGYANVTATVGRRRLRRALASDATAQTEAIAKKAETIAEAKPSVAAKTETCLETARPTGETKKLYSSVTAATQTIATAETRVSKSGVA